MNWQDIKDKGIAAINAVVVWCRANPKKTLFLAALAISFLAGAALF